MNEFHLADRSHRLIAAIIDSVAAFTLPAIVVIFATIFVIDDIGNMDEMDENNLALMGFLILVTLLPVAIYQIVLLTKYGKTIGKRIMKIKIVKHDTLENGGFVYNVLLRVIVNGIILWCPCIGLIYYLVDSLFIFRIDKRCIHDFIAGTIVIKEIDPQFYTLPE